MSFRDVTAMLQCLFYVNDLPGGVDHHDGGMKGRDPGPVLSNRLLALTPEERAAFERLRAEKKRTVVTTARPARGTPNLTLSHGGSREGVAAGARERGQRPRRIRARLRGGGREVSEPVLLRVVRSRSVDQAGQGDGARAEDASLRDDASRSRPRR